MPRSSVTSTSWLHGSLFPSLGTSVLAIFSIAGLLLIRRALGQLIRLLNYPYPADGIEGTLLSEARLLHSGQPLYQPLQLHRFISAPYTPLHPLIAGLADRLPGPHVFWGGRLVSTISTLLVALLIVLLVRRVSRSLLAGLLGAALFLAAPPVILWGTRVKPDLFALMWAVLGLLLAVLALGGETEHAPPAARSSVKWPLLSAAAFVVAFTAKQTALAGPLAAGLALLVADARAFLRPLPGARPGLCSFRRIALFGLAYLGLVAAFWFALQMLTSGQFAAHVLGLHRKEWWSMYLVRKYVRLLAPYVPLMLLSLVLPVRACWDDRALVPLCYALVAPFTLLGAAEISANHNHLLETILALVIAGCSTLGWAARLRLPRMWLSAPIMALFAIQLALAFRPQPWFRGEMHLRDTPARFIAFVRHTPGEVLTDDVGLLVAAGRPVRYDDPSTMGPASITGVWDPRGLLQEIAERRFSAIMIPDDVRAEPPDHVGRWTSQMRAVIRAHYRLKFDDRIKIYVPR